MKHNKLKRMIQCAIFAAILCIFSPLSVSVGPIPFSMAIFAVMLCAVVLDLRSAVISVLVYLVLGLCGLPIFSGGNPGLVAIPGPTGGYIWSFALMVPVIALFKSIPVKALWLRYVLTFAGCVVATALCYVCGTLQFAHIAGKTFREALAVCVIPFIVPDLIKGLVATVLGTILSDTLQKAGVLTLR